MAKLFDGMQVSALECFIEDQIIDKMMEKEWKNGTEALPPIQKEKDK